MKRSFSGKANPVLRTVCSVVILGATVGLTACAKPPDCSSPSLADNLHKMLVGKLGELARNEPFDDPNGLIDKFLASVRFETITAVSDGYDSNAKKQLCKMSVSVEAADTKPETWALPVGLQNDQEKGGVFISTEGAGPLLLSLSEKLDRYYQAHRFSGAWTGAYACEGIDAEETDADKAFSQQVTMKVVNRAAKLERTTPDGGFEKLAGEIAEDLSLIVAGDGRSPDERWKAGYEGTVKGNSYTAKGGIQRQGLAEDMRQCELNLTFKPER